MRHDKTGRLWQTGKAHHTRQGNIGQDQRFCDAGNTRGIVFPNLEKGQLLDHAASDALQHSSLQRRAQLVQDLPLLQGRPVKGIGLQSSACVVWPW